MPFLKMPKRAKIEHLVTTLNLEPTHAAHISFDDIRDKVDSMSISDILILLSSPGLKEWKFTDDIRTFSHDVLGKRMADLESNRDLIMRIIMQGVFPRTKFDNVDVTDYLGKYEFLVSHAFPQAKGDEIREILLDEIDAKNVDKIMTEIIRFRNEIPLYLDNPNKNPSREFDALRDTPVNLRFYYPSSDSVNSPLYICTKRKADDRIGLKIPRYVVKGLRESQHAEKGLNLSPFNKNLREYLYDRKGLSKAQARDIVGIQIAVPDKMSLDKVKEYITMSRDIKVLELQDYYEKPFGPYHAIHMTVRYSPSRSSSNRKSSLNNNVELLFYDSIEIILIEQCYAVSSNFGPEGYYRRMTAQEQGIVDKSVEYGKLRVSKFTNHEKRFVAETRKRICDVLANI